MLIQAIIIIVVVLIISRIFLQFKSKKINLRELVFWTVLWLLLVVVVLLPQTVNLLADYMGVGRGVDVVIYLSIIVLFYIIFRIFARLEKLERDITKIVRHLALKDNPPTGGKKDE